MRRTGMMVAGSILGLAVLASAEAFGEGPHAHSHPRPIQWFSGTYLDPAIPRPDLFPRVVWNNIPEHRQVYNRPRYGTGKFLYHFEPTSQEAMAWETNVRNGNYRNHRGASVPMYWYPKPWEALNTRARPDFQQPSGVETAPEGTTLLELVEPASP
ncbi:MAG: hypothetical protein ACK553_18100 [Planctomycetota bacterium]|jgi:hypothetical protein